MATRPVFIPVKKTPFVSILTPEFEWNGGFALSQSRKNIRSLHTAFNRLFPEKKVLDISSKSPDELGVKLSAFNLKKYVPELGTSIPVECVFQGGKVFTAGGPYTDLYNVTPREAKKDERLRNSGTVKSFYFNGNTISTTPKTAFYDWLYINALIENPQLSDGLNEYDAFTDIAFSPNKSINCQARAAAVFKALKELDLLDKCQEFPNYLELLKGNIL